MKNKLDSLQVLRALAAFAVVFHHAQVFARNAAGLDLPQSTFGAAGVDLFFVLSGFIMVYVSEGRSRSFGVFAWHRFVRIFPVFWLATAAYAALPLLPGLGFDHTSLEFILKSAFLIPAENPVTGRDQLLVFVGWTLRYELFFYLVFGLACLTRHRIIWAFFGLMIAHAAMSAFGGNALFHELTKFRLLVLEFVFGMGLARIHIDAGEKIQRWVDGLPGWTFTALCLSIPATGSLFVLMDPNLFDMGQGLERAMRWGVPALLFTGATLWVLPRLLRHLGAVRSALVAMGDASYSVYLFHAPIIWILSRSRVLHGLDGWLGYATILTVVFVAVGLISWVIYQTFERPMTARLQRLSPLSAFASKG